MKIQNYLKNIFNIISESQFNDLAIQLFTYQYNNNSIYKKYIQLIDCNTKTIKYYDQIPYLPIEFFRTHKVISGINTEEAIFKSSGTTNSQKSSHYVMDISIYKKSIINCFNLFIGDPKDFVFLCFIPEKNKHPNSSLSFMAYELIKNSNNANSGFFINKTTEMIKTIKKCQTENQKFILFGLSFEILDFAEKNQISLHNGLIIETGGTKKNNKHLMREELHNKLKAKFKTNKIYSEYGMAELLSQSYYTDQSYFQSPPWKKILLRDKTNPLKIIKQNQRGLINIIDLANIYSCGFIATNDFGETTNNGFNVIGRNHNAIARGCNLMI